MYMRVTRARIDPAKLDEARDKVGQDLVAAVSRLPGYQSYMVGADRAAGRTLSVSTWDTEEQARWSPDAVDAVGDILFRLQALGLQVESTEIFEVSTPT